MRKEIAAMTQEDKVFNYMKDNGSITQLQALYDIGVMRLASRISDMKKAGIGIEKKMVPVKCRDGSTAYVAQHSLQKKESEDPGNETA